MKENGKMFLFDDEPNEMELISIENEAENEDEVLLDDNSELLNVDSVKQYFKEIGAIKLLSLQEEQDLGWKVYAGKQAKEELPFLESGDEIADCQRIIAEGKDAQQKLVEANLRLVASIAKKYSCERMDFLDIIEEGNFGLMKAASKFDVTKGFRFSTYATWWIKQSIQRGINDQGNLIRIPVHMAENISKIKKAQRKLSAELGREVTNAEVAEHLNKEVEKVDEILQNSKNITFLETPVGEDGETSLQDYIEDETALSPENMAMDSFARSFIGSVIDSLPERQAQVIRYLYGFYGRTYTLEEVGDIYGLSRERVRQIREDALKRIRRNKKNYNQLKDYYTL
jgi:RNA polymerase primary sigma factor